ncbi:hypothetical protein FQN51_007413 [Onygenales sp. PD_10]|nr:hypothetical protein FQN51_007413 [Onygenales sp. PD_10]
MTYYQKAMNMDKLDNNDEYGSQSLRPNDRGYNGLSEDTSIENGGVPGIRNRQRVFPLQEVFSYSSNLSDLVMGLAGNYITLAACGIGIMLCIACKAIYNVYFHPLRNFPGPKHLAAGRIPVTVATLRGRKAQFRFKLHRKYGEIVRIAANELSFAHAQGWKDIYGTNAKVQKIKPISGVEEEEGGAQSVVTAEGDTHTKQKRIMKTMFSEKMLREKESVFIGHVDQLIQRLLAFEGRPLSLADWYSFTTFDIIGDLLFGEPLGMLSRSDYVPWVKAVPDFVKAFVLIVVLYQYRLFRICWALVPWKLLKGMRKTHFSYTGQKVDQYLGLKEGFRKGILDHLLDAGSSRGLLVSEVHKNAPILVFGGSDTAATQLRCLTYPLFKNPGPMKRLVSEIRSAYASSDQITYDSLLEQKYLNACIEEGLRYYPTCINGQPRVVPEDGATICGKFVAAGTIVSVATYSLHRSSEYFYLPDTFAPERWLQENEGGSPLFSDDVKSLVLPFSYGPHNCPARKMGYYEIRLILTKILWHFDLELLPEGGGEKDSWDDMENYQTWVKLPLMVIANPVMR